MTLPPSATPADIHATPKDLRWETFQGIAVPVSAESGPNDPYSVAAHGYAHSPQGAALAAIGSTIRISVATDSQWPGVASQLVAPGAGRDEWIITRVTVSITEPARLGEAPQVLGYRITDYNAGSAAVTVISRQPDASLTATDTKVVWNGDWKLLLPQSSEGLTVQHALDTAPTDMVALAR